MQRTIDLPALDLRADVNSIDASDRSVQVIFSTGADVTRMDWMTGQRYIERLSLDPKHVQLDRLNMGAPLLNSHSAESLADQIGVVVDGSATVDGRVGRARIRFSKRTDVEPIWQDVRDGIVRNISVGYRVHQFEETAARGGALPIRTATLWQPYEVSLVPMGADAGARVRSAGATLNRCVIVGARALSTADADRARRFRLAQARAR